MAHTAGYRRHYGPYIRRCGGRPGRGETSVRSLRAGVSLFTVIPVGGGGELREGDAARAVLWMPAVGLLLGLAGAGVMAGVGAGGAGGARRVGGGGGRGGAGRA